MRKLKMVSEGRGRRGRSAREGTVGMATARGRSAQEGTGAMMTARGRGGDGLGAVHETATGDETGQDRRGEEIRKGIGVERGVGTAPEAASIGDEKIVTNGVGSQFRMTSDPARDQGNATESAGAGRLMTGLRDGEVKRLSGGNHLDTLTLHFMECSGSITIGRKRIRTSMHHSLIFFLVSFRLLL